MSAIRFFKARLKSLRYTVLHPQWLILREERSLFRTAGRGIAGTVLDIGCGDMWVRDHLPAAVTDYIGLDYLPTARDWYGTRAHVYADASGIPLRDASIDAVLMLNVLEHLPDVGRCLDEARRVLRSDGKCLIDVPFLYPVHDAPRDFQRWTVHGLERLVTAHGLRVSDISAIGRPPATLGLLFNVGASKWIADRIRRRNPLMLGVVLLAVIVPIVNLLAWLFSALWRDNFMPIGYRLVAIKAP